MASLAWRGGRKNGIGIPSLGQKASRSSEEEDVACPFHDPDEEEDAFFAILLLLLLRQTLANHAIFGFGCIPPDWLVACQEIHLYFGWRRQPLN